MPTVFSHIIQKRFSQQHEDVATDALCFILQSHEPARKGFMKLLRGISADVPTLEFQTQMEEDNMRPDMWGLDETGPRMFVESKFWAGLTDNQPVSYLRKLAVGTRPSILLFIAPEAREHTLWRELGHRLDDDDVVITEKTPPAGIAYTAKTEIGPILALTSWRKVLSSLERELADDREAQSDLHQLRSLCRAADKDAFVPLSREVVTNQQFPALVRQLADLMFSAIDTAEEQGCMKKGRLMPQANHYRAGRYQNLITTSNRAVGTWCGVHFDLWETHGTSPFWLIFPASKWGRASEIQPLLEPWASAKGIVTASAL